MAHVIGPKGQLVIEKAIRDRLGVGPGWKAVQQVVDDHVELRFLPPVHSRSLAGCLKPHISPERLRPTEAELERAVADGFAEAYREEDARCRTSR